ncbi:hypothetical protein A6J66_011000 [Yersinia enterocolitica]|nr:hypothetical protein A6J66_011000 [Yersinia enterocolitica]
MHPDSFSLYPPSFKLQVCWLRLLLGPSLRGRCKERLNPLPTDLSRACRLLDEYWDMWSSKHFTAITSVYCIYAINAR